MTQTRIQKSFAPLKKLFPACVYNPIRSIATVVIGPSLSAYRSGYYRSAIKREAVTRSGKPLPWYTYPCIDFLKHRNYKDKVILELGGGQSTLWWAARANHVVTLEGDWSWYEKLSKKVPNNVSLGYVSMESSERNVSDVKRLLNEGKYTSFDVIVIDGLYRYEMIEVAMNWLSSDGIVICDNAEGYGFYEGLKATRLSRVVFFGNAPGVVLPHATSIVFGPTAFVFKSHHPIPVVANDFS